MSHDCRIPRIAEVAARIARVLDAAQIPNILWGWAAVTLVGDSVGIPGEADFVIPDSQIDSAKQAMKDAGISMCTNGNCCKRYGITASFIHGVRLIELMHPVPAAHYHVGVDEWDVSLLRKSGILNWLPDYTVGPPATDDPNLMLSNDPKLPAFYEDVEGEGPSGPWTGVYPMKILNPNALTKATIFLMARDWAEPPIMTGKQSESPCEQWEEMSVHLSESHRPRVPGYIRELEPMYQLVWDSLEFRGSPEYDMYVPLILLRELLIETGQLPSDLRKVDITRLRGWDRLPPFEK
ncbi:hypothetical protein BJX99DRAFT_254388 [Aspergillus californicus]